MYTFADAVWVLGDWKLLRIAKRFKDTDMKVKSDVQVSAKAKRKRKWFEVSYFRLHKGRPSSDTDYNRLWILSDEHKMISSLENTMKNEFRRRRSKTKKTCLEVASKMFSVVFE